MRSTTLSTTAILSNLNIAYFTNSLEIVNLLFRFTKIIWMEFKQTISINAVKIVSLQQTIHCNSSPNQNQSNPRLGEWPAWSLLSNGLEIKPNELNSANQLQQIVTKCPSTLPTPAAGWVSKERCRKWEISTCTPLPESESRDESKQHTINQIKWSSQNQVPNPTPYPCILHHLFTRNSPPNQIDLRPQKWSAWSPLYI